MRVRAKEPAPTRKAVLAEVAKRYAARIHMTLIIAGAVAPQARTAGEDVNATLSTKAAD